MAGSSGLIAQPLNQSETFNWVLLVELLVCGVLAVFFFGYFDRLFATLVSYGIRWYTWRNFHAYIDIQALQISLLGGRIFFKDVRYHAHNESIFIHSGFITWKYWHRKVRDAEVFATESPKGKNKRSASSSRSRSRSLDREEKGGSKPENRSLPCRLRVQVEGLQAFIYNRSPAYDSIIASFLPDADGLTSSIASGRGGFKDLGVEITAKPHNASDLTRSEGDLNGEKSKEGRSASWQKPEPPVFLKLFPIQVDCKTGAAVLGNNNTKCILTAKFESASGVFDAGHAGPLDSYKQLFDFEVIHPVIQMKPNLDFQEVQLATAARVKEGLGDSLRPKSQQHRNNGRLWTPWKHSNSDESVAGSSKVKMNRRETSAFQQPDGQERWRGLSRYLDETMRDEHDEWDPVEYARSSILADIPRIGFSFYWDVAGVVPPRGVIGEEVLEEDPDDINGSAAPEYGMELFIRGNDKGQGGSITYGPWADRQRINLQSIFFPANHSDAIPASRLSPGDTRILSKFKLFLSVETEVVVRIPLRERSKDWKWKGQADAATTRDTKNGDKTGTRKRRPFWKSRDKTTIGSNMRPFGWLDVKVAPSSTVTYEMDMVARGTGYGSQVNADIRGLEMSSSVNHGLLWRSGPLALNCDLSVPVGWNALRKWKFDIFNEDLELFILREHLFLLTDLITDWSSGPMADYYTFVPYQYSLNVSFNNFKLYLNTNDSNIINNPAELDDNLFVILYGEELKGNVIIPLINYRPVKNEIFFDVTGHNLGLELCMNSRITVATFTGRKKFALLDEVTLKGSHAYFSETSPNLTDRLTFFIHGRKLILTVFGFVVSHLIKIKENYFGEYLHFRTLEEYQELTRVGTNLSAEHNTQSISNKSNDLDVILCISAEDVSGILPANMYTSEESVMIELPYASVDLRITNYYMDLQVDFSPLSISYRKIDQLESGTELFIESATIVGHRLFGLPPTEPTYVCSWNIDVGKIAGECSSTFLKIFVRAIRCFVFSLNDDENATPLIAPEEIHDITFLRLRTETLKVWFHVDSEAILLSTDPVSVEFNDWAGSTFSQRLKAVVPNITLACVNRQFLPRQRFADDARLSVETHAFINTTLSFAMLQRKPQFTAERRKQQSHLIESDQRTKRATFLVLDPEARYENPLHRTDPPAMIYPPIPEPKSFEYIEQQPPISWLQNSMEKMLHHSAGFGTQPLRRPNLNRQMSNGSIKASLREIDAARRLPPSIDVPKKPNRASSAKSLAAGRAPKDDHNEHLPGVPPFSIALSPQFASPFFPLDYAEIDIADVPILEQLDMRQDSDAAASVFDGTMNANLDDTLAHVSLILTVEPGIRGYCRPPAIEAISNLLNTLAPKTPEELLDVFQIEVLGQIMDAEKKAQRAGTSIEISFRVPQISFCLLNTVTAQRQAGADQFDIQLKRLTLIARHQFNPRASVKTSTSLAHCSIESATISAKGRRSDSVLTGAAVTVRLNDILLWLSASEASKANISVRGLHVEVGSGDVHHLVAMVRRTTSLVDSSIAEYNQQTDNRRKRFEYLAYKLTKAGANISDPPFLTRASYVMRTTAHHPRNHDSWKVISRFRYIYQSLSEEVKQELREGSLRAFDEYPADAESEVLNVWDQWRTWDLAHVRKSLAFQYLYGKILGVGIDSEDSASKPLQVEFRSAAIRFILDHNNQQSELHIAFPVIKLSVIRSPSPTGLMVIEETMPTRNLNVETSAKLFHVRLNWHITHIAERLLQVLEQDEGLQASNIASSIKSKASTLTTPTWSKLQAVAVLEDAAVTLGSVNIRAYAASKMLKISALGLDRSATTGKLSGSVLLHADTSKSEFRSHSRVLLRAKADAPNLYLSKDELAETSPRSPSLIVTASSSHIAVELKEEILGVLEVIDSLIRDEVAYVEDRLMPMIRRAIQKPKTADIVSDLPRINVALLMDSYQIDVALLRSLIYSVSGRTARVSISPGLRRRLALDLNFDLDQHSHNLASHAHAESQIISALKLPPINGHVRAIQSHDTVSLNIIAAIETIILEASAVHGLLSTLQRPEVSQTFSAVQSDIDIIKHRLKEILPQSPPGTPATPASDLLNGRRLTYNLSATLHGLEITADAPAKTPSSGVASLTLDLNCVQLKATNTLDNGRSLLPMPEIHGRLRQFVLVLSIKDDVGARQCGNLAFSASVHCTVRNGRLRAKRKYQTQVDAIEVNIFAETASAVVDVLNHLQDMLKELDLSRERRYLERLRQPSRRPSIHLSESMDMEASTASTGLFTSAINVSLLDIQIAWIVGSSVSAIKGVEKHDLVLSIKMIDMATKSECSSRLSIEDLQLQMVPASQNKRQRFINSALLPEMVFNVTYLSSNVERMMSFQAAGKSLDIRLEPRFIVPASIIEKSVHLAVENFKEATASWQMIPTSTGGQRKNPFGDKRLASLLVDIDFAGAVVQLQENPQSLRARGEQKGRYGQFVSGDTTAASLRSPGLAVRVEFKDDGAESSLNAELMVSASSNILTPTVVPLFLELSEGIKTVVGETDKSAAKPFQKSPQTTFLTDEGLLTADPSELLGKTRLNLGIRICSQEFSLSCQPIARVSATARFDDIYITANSIKATEQDHFFAISAAFERLQASVQHVYSRQSTFSFEMQRIVLSFMNSRHLSGTAGISAILKIYPTRTRINVKQLQDFLLFREIWLPQEIRQSANPATPDANVPDTQEYLVQRYRQVATAAAFPWNATVAIAEMIVELDLGQAIGKSSLTISQLWASSRKQSNWEQNLCIGVGKIGIASTGRMSGFIELAGLNIRTMITWPNQHGGLQQTPRIQASIGFDNLRVKTAFDYQAFAVADVSRFGFLMYNIRDEKTGSKDRLVAILDGDQINAYCTATSAAQALALYQAFERLIQENQQAYEQSLNDVEKYIRRKSIATAPRTDPKDQDVSRDTEDEDDKAIGAPISLYTDVMVTLKSISIGAFPSAFSDNQIFLIDASNVQARFAVMFEADKIHSSLGMTLGQLRVALAAVVHPSGPKTLQEITVDHVVNTAVTARGGTILRVPKVIAAMQTWQAPASYQIDYIFKSSFEGKVDVGWNYARIGFIRGMWNTHSRALASRLGKPLPEPTVKITTTAAGEPEPNDKDKEKAECAEPSDREKITAVVNVPQSKYEYHAREPPIIETPQLRDMGEATPPLEWIGLHRDRLPNLTHQIVIVALLGVAKEVEDAYGRILGNS